jgi:hypothetical protein
MVGEKYHEIARLAYGYWEAEGRPDGRAVDHWLRAESELNGPSLKENARKSKAVKHKLDGARVAGVKEPRQNAKARPQRH